MIRAWNQRDITLTNMIYKITNYTKKVTSTGKPMARATLENVDNQTVTENVTVWSNFPNFENLDIGFTVEGTVEEVQNGKYLNRTLKPLMTNTLNRPPKTQNQAIVKAMEKKQENIKESQENKQEGIRQAAIIRDSTLLTCAYWQGKESTIEDMKKSWEEWNKWITNKWEVPF